MMGETYKYNHVALGGTFDRPHIGQLALIDLAFEVGEKVSLGLTKESLYQNKTLSDTIKSYKERKEELKAYLRGKGWLLRTLFSPLYDIYGPAKIDRTIEAVVVSEETYPNAQKINKEREKRSLPVLDIITIPLIKGEDGKIVTGERIRRGEIDRKGRPYEKIFEGKRTLKLPTRLRESLRNPLGKVIEGSDEKLKRTAEKSAKIILSKKPTLLVTVGDVVSWSLLKEGIEPDIAILDFKRRRKKTALLKPYVKKRPLTAINKPGTIDHRLVKTLKEAFKQSVEEGRKRQIVVEGEEDLTALPAVLLAPLGSLVLYGQYNLGVVLIEATEDKKSQIEKILLQFN